MFTVIQSETQLFSNKPPTDAVERVKAHLEEAYLGQKAQAGMRLPPVRTLANRLSVSTATILKAIRQLEAAGQLVSRSGSGVFISENAGSAFASRCITLATTWPDEPDRWEYIYSQAYQQAIVRAGVQDGRRVSILPLGSREWTQEQTLERLIAEREFVDGLLLLPIRGYRTEQMMRVADAYREVGKPVVSFWPQSPLVTCNFIGLGALPAARNAVLALAAAGRRHLLLVLNATVAGSHYESQIFLGAHIGKEIAGRDCRLSVEVCTADEAFVRVVRKYRGGSAPRVDGILTGGHFQALTMLDVLKNEGYSVPEDVSLLTLSHLGDACNSEVDLSGMLNPYEEMGERLVAMMLKLLQDPERAHPGVYLPIGYHAGATTLSSENSFLQKEHNHQ